MKKAISFVYIFLVYSTIHSQTTIIVNKTKDAIYVGADSRGASFETIAGHQPVNLCKIGTVGNFNFVISGVGFPMALEECKKACLIGNNFDDVIGLFAPAFMKKLQDSLEVTRQLMPKLFNELTLSKEVLSSVAFFGKQGDSLYLAQVKFRCETGVLKPVQISGSGGKYENKPTIIALGMTDEIKDIVFKDSIWQKGVVNGIKQLIKIEAKAHPQKVSEPIDILKVTMDENIWIQRKKICN